MKQRFYIAMQSNLARNAATNPRSDDELWEMKHKAWQNLGDIYFNHAQIEAMPSIDRLTLELLAQKEYGKRG
jgi:hypothetical protein